MEKTAMQILIEWMETPAMRLNDEMSAIKKAQQLLVKEKEQLCAMYVQGRNDSHLDYYPNKHAEETYNEKFCANLPVSGRSEQFFKFIDEHYSHSSDNYRNELKNSFAEWCLKNCHNV